MDELCLLGNDLFREHYDEIARNKRVMVLKPDWLRYKALEQMDSLIMLGAWQDGMLVGYAASFITTHLHYSDMLFVQNDVLFVAREHRRSRLGIRLIRETERIASESGADLIMWHAKESTALAQILPRLGYGVQDIVFAREV